MLMRWRTMVAMAAWLLLFLFTMVTTRVAFVAPLSFLVVVLITWDYGIRPALAWIAVIHLFIPFMLFVFGLGPFYVFADAREVVAGILVVTLLTVVALAFLTDWVHSLLQELRASKAALQDVNDQLQGALAEVKELRGMLRICAWCKQIQDQNGNWLALELYLVNHTRAELTHGMCPKCLTDQMALLK